MATVYLIDHETAQLAALRAGLEADGLQVLAAEEAGDWLSQARALRPACIVLAVELSGISGYSVCNKIKRDRELAPVPLLLVSSQASPGTFAEHARLRTHADAYAHKPYDVPAVVQVVRSLLRPAATPAAAPEAKASSVSASALAAASLSAAGPLPEAAPTEAAAPGVAAVASTRRPARFGEEPSVIEPAGSPFFPAEGTATEPSADPPRGATETHAAPEAGAVEPKHARDPVLASRPADPGLAAAALASAPGGASPDLVTDAQILLERAVDTQNQTRVYDTLAPRGPDASKSSPADLIAAALGDLDAANVAQTRGTGPASSPPELPHVGASRSAGVGAPLAGVEPGSGDAELAALRAELQAARARAAQLQTERDRALAAGEAQAATLERLRQLLG